MDPRLRNFLVGLTASILAVWIGISVAQEDYLIAALSAGFSLWIILSWTRGPLAEAWLLAFLVGGYVIGNRGFAQITPAPGLPVFFSELGLGFAFSLVVLRSSLHRQLPIRRDWLNALLLVWLGLGASRLMSDVRTFGFMALRDSAMVYYTLYFFVGQNLASHVPSQRLLRHTITITFALLPLFGLLSIASPTFFLSNFIVGGVPLIFFKGDLLAAFLFTGFIILLPGVSDQERGGWWRWPAAIVSLVLGLSLLSRASMVGLFLAMGWLVLAGRPRPLRVFAMVCAAGLMIVTLISLFQKDDFTQTKAYAIYESVASIADVSGTRKYQGGESSNKGDNNQFRLVWWKNIAEETLTNSPLLGLGFGADLSRGFLQEYYPTNEMEWTTRSPHNIFVTTLGRMGLIGTAVLFAIYWVQGRITLKLARRARQNPSMQDAMTLQAGLWVVMVAACFGVVFEGPMGAIPFWIILGLTHQAANAEEPPPEDGLAADAAEEPATADSTRAIST